MRPLIPLIFDPIEENGGLSYFDLGATVIMAFALMFVVAFATEHNYRKAGIALLVTLIPIPLASARRLVILCALGVVAIRFAVVLCFLHPRISAGVFVTVLLFIHFTRRRPLY